MMVLIQTILRFGVNHIYINFVINIWEVFSLSETKSGYINTLKIIITEL